MRALIADDEANLRAALRRRLAEVWPELEIVAEASDGAQALELAADTEPDIAFLDIRMPGLDGLEVARRLSGRCHLVFVTAYDEYAVDAFERDAVDYLLKPVTAARLQKTVARLRSRTEQQLPENLNQLLDQLSAQLHIAPRQALQWIHAGHHDRVQMIAVSDIRCFIAADKYTTVHSAEKELPIRKPIKELEAELDPQQFWRIHRGAIVNLSYVESGYRDDSGRLWLNLREHSEPLAVSRAYAHRFRQM
jgi:DNA-binding LytR/AlgR family response regulator